MAKEIVVTKQGRATIPIEIKRKLGISEGSRLEIKIHGKKIILTKVPSIFDLAGTAKLTMDQALTMLDDMRRES